MDRAAADTVVADKAVGDRAAAGRAVEAVQRRERNFARNQYHTDS